MSLSTLRPGLGRGAPGAIFMATMGNMTANQHLYARMAVDPLRALAPITKVVDVHFAFLANPALAAGNVAELIVPRRCAAPLRSC